MIMINNINLPKNCSYCRFCFEEDIMFETAWRCDLTGSYMNDDHDGDYLDDCPLSEVIQCKNCINFFNNHLCLHWSKYGTIEVKPDDYCSYGGKI